MTPTRKKYEDLFLRHKSQQAIYDQLMAKVKTHRTTYLRHRQHFISLSNALLVSNTAMRTAPRPIDHATALTHATLFFTIRDASHTLVKLMVQEKRLAKARDMARGMDEELYLRCRECFRQVDWDCVELDRLHAKVVETEVRMGMRPECGMVEGGCLSCRRLWERVAKEKEERAKEMEVMMRKEKKGKGRKGKGSGGDAAGKGVGGKERLETIVEKEGAEDEE